LQHHADEGQVIGSGRIEATAAGECRRGGLLLQRLRLQGSVRLAQVRVCSPRTVRGRGRIRGPSFEQLLMRIVETMLPRDGRGPPTNSDEYYFAIRDLFPHVPVENDVLGRLLFFAMRMCQLRLEKHPNLNLH
jgi:hypothetical protein